MKKEIASKFAAAVSVAAGAAFAAAAVAPSAENLAARLVLPDYAIRGETATGRIAYSNRLSSASLDAPTFVVRADGAAAFADGAKEIRLSPSAAIPPNGAGEIAFEFAAADRHRMTLAVASGYPAPSSVTADAPSESAPPFAAVLPAGPAPLTTAFLVLGDGRPVASCSWDFDGDGAADSAAEAPIWTFNAVGAHPVTLSVVYADGDAASWTIDDAVTVWDAPETRLDAAVLLVGASSYDYSIVEDSDGLLVLYPNGDDPRAVAAGTVIVRHGKPLSPLRAVKVSETNEGRLRVVVEPCPLTEAYASLSLSSLLRPAEGSGGQTGGTYSLPAISNDFAIAMGDAVRLDAKLTNSMSFACSIDIRTVNGIRRVRRFYGGVAGAFGADVATSVRTPDGLISGGIDATVDFGAPPLAVWAGPKVSASANVGADLAVRARGRFVKGVLYDGGRLVHAGGAVLEDFDRARDVRCPLAFADATVFAGLEIGAALGFETPAGSVSATILSLSARAGIRADAEARLIDGVAERTLDVKVRPVAELEFVPVSVSVFDVVDWTPVVKTHTVEGPAWTFSFSSKAGAADGAALPAEALAHVQSLPVAVVDAAADVAAADVPDALPGDAAEWLEEKGLSGFGADAAAMRGVMARPSGKAAQGGALAPIWSDYVAGTDPADGSDVFTASISFTNGSPRIEWKPDLKDRRRYTVSGTSDLSLPFTSPTNSTHRFFKVEVGL